MKRREACSQAKFEYRNMKPEEADRLIEIEHTCFPPQQAMPKDCMRDLMSVAGDLFLVAIDSQTGEPVASLFGMATNEERFRDDYFFNSSLHESDGKNIMLLGLEVLPAYRGSGLARALMERYLETERKKNRHEIFLTCVEGKVTMYKKMGFVYHGLSASTLGGETWHDMSIILN